MKTTILSLLFLFSFCSLRAGQPESIQSEIETALNVCFTQQSATPLAEIREKLEKQDNPMSVYWQAYALFYEAIYYMKTGQRDLCKSSVDKAEDLLEKQQKKTSEDYALLAYIQSFVIQFAQGREAGQAAATATTNAEKATRLDSTNVRGWYVLASMDYYTPAAYGGGQKATNYLQKAVSLPDPTVRNPWLPAWGKDDAYGMLIGLYLQQGKKEEARVYYEALRKRSPESYLVWQYAEKFR